MTGDRIEMDQPSATFSGLIFRYQSSISALQSDAIGSVNDIIARSVRA